MPRTFRNYVDSLRWRLGEKGLHRTWDELNQLANSIVGNSVVTGAMTYGEIDMLSESFLQSGATGTFSGSFSANNVAAGKQQLSADPGGASGGAETDIFGTPVPVRKSERTPTGGFRNA